MNHWLSLFLFLNTLHETRFIGKNRQEIIMLISWQNRDEYVMILFVCEYIKRSQVSKFGI
jgi:hypothetical protein